MNLLAGGPAGVADETPVRVSEIAAGRSPSLASSAVCAVAVIYLVVLKEEPSQEPNRQSLSRKASAKGSATGDGAAFRYDRWRIVALVPDTLQNVIDPCRLRHATGAVIEFLIWYDQVVMVATGIWCAAQTEGDAIPQVIVADSGRNNQYS